MRSISVTVNGVSRKLDVDEDRRLLWVLRDDLGLTGTKFGCGVSSCGACTVIVDGKAVHSCVTSMKAVEGKRVTTIEGLADGDHLAPVQQGFVDHLGFQCGYCTPGQICSAVALLKEHKHNTLSALSFETGHTNNPELTDNEIRERMSGNICRCGAYPNIVAAVRAAAKGVSA